MNVIITIIINAFHIIQYQNSERLSWKYIEYLDLHLLLVGTIIQISTLSAMELYFLVLMLTGEFITIAGTVSWIKKPINDLLLNEGTSNNL